MYKQLTVSDLLSCRQLTTQTWRAHQCASNIDLNWNEELHLLIKNCFFFFYEDLSWIRTSFWIKRFMKMTNKMLLELGFLGHFFGATGIKWWRARGTMERREEAIHCLSCVPTSWRGSITLNSFMKYIQSNILTLDFFILS